MKHFLWVAKFDQRRKTCGENTASTVILSSKSGIQGKVVLPLGSLGVISSCGKWKAAERL